MEMFYIVLLVFFGLLFLVAELVLLPGVSIGAVLALVCYGSSVYLAFRDFGPVTGTVVILVILVLSVIATVVSLRAKTWQRFSLKQEIRSSSMPVIPAEELQVGDRGVIGLCKAAKLEGEDGIIDQGYSLNAGRYVGVVIEDDGMTEAEFKETMLGLNAEYESLNEEAKKLETQISLNLRGLFKNE